MFQRYNFNAIFAINVNTGDIYPLYNTYVNGQYFRQFFSIPRGLYFGGINIYEYVGRDFGGYWNNQTQILTLTTVY